MTLYALVNSAGTIENVIEYDGTAQFTPPSGLRLVASGSVAPVIGGTYTNDMFAPPATLTPPTPTVAQQAAILIANGLTITSTTTSALNGVYNVQSGVPFGQEQIANEAQFISTYSEFTNGATTNLQWPLLNGSLVIFPTTSEFLAFAKAVAQFIAAVTLAASQSGLLPAATAAIL